MSLERFAVAVALAGGLMATLQGCGGGGDVTTPSPSPPSSLCGIYSTADEIAHGQSLSHRVAIVTGGDSGLGYATAKTMAKHGATVVIASHNLAKCQAAARNISSTVGGNVVGMKLDLGSFASVRNFTAQFLKDFTVLNYLINNAGISQSAHVTRSPSYKTEDGFEDVFQINYLGHFLLTELLLPILRNNRGFSPSRIVNTGSVQHHFACYWLNASEGCLKDWAFLPPPISREWVNPDGTVQGTTTYGLSKLALIEHAAEISAREANNSIQAFSVAPGFVDTKIQHVANYTAACAALAHLQPPCPYTPEQGAAVIAACAFTAAHAGGYYARQGRCGEAPVGTNGLTTAMRSELYDRSLQWVGPAPLPAQCHNEILHLSPIRYIAAASNYSNCELKGQVGTVIQGMITLVRFPGSYGVNSLVLSGTMVLDQMSLALSGAPLHIKGDEIIVKDTHIEGGLGWASTLAVDGGRASFESTRMLSCDISLTNTTVTFSNTSSTSNGLSGRGTHISHSNVSMMKSSIGQGDEGGIEIVASILDLTDSNLTTSHGSVSLRNSNATFLRSTVILEMGRQSMNIEKSSVVADCGSEEFSVFMIGNGADGPGVHVASSQLTFHASCDWAPPTAVRRCDMSRAIRVGIGRAPISIDASSVHFEPCIPSEEARSVLV